MYAKINGSDEKYNISLSSFETQNGNVGIRVIGSMPATDKGFKVYDDEDKLVGDYSEFTYEYNPNEYTKVSEEKIPASGTDAPLPPSAYDILSRSISNVNNRVSQITPYVMTKDVYIGETSCEFDLVKNGNITAWLTTQDVQLACNFEVIENKIIVSFEELEEVGTVSVSIQ